MFIKYKTVSAQHRGEMWQLIVQNDVWKIQGFYPEPYSGRSANLVFKDRS